MHTHDETCGCGDPSVPSLYNEHDEPEHTAGPWRVGKSGGCVVNDAGEVIAELANTPLRITPEVEANARLFAAAPELLEGCKKLLEVINHPNLYTPDSNLNKKRTFVEAAIVKAEGRA